MKHPRGTWGIACGVLVAAAGILAWVWWGRSELPGIGRPVLAAAPTPAALPPTRQLGLADVTPTVADLFGINEAVAVPEKFLRNGSLTPDEIRRHLESDAATARQLGARHVRANTANYPFLSWYEVRRHPEAVTRADEYVAIAQGAGLELLLMLGPWPGNQTANYTERYVPEDLADYAAYVRETVERYDGDGVGDAPGLLRPVRYWEVDNEPDLHNSRPPRDARRKVDPATFETPAEYARVLVVTADAIRQADPAARVLNAGTFSTGRATGRNYLERTFREPGAAAAVDVLSIHAYFEEQTPEGFEAALDTARDVGAGRPIFVTETSVPSLRRGSAWVSEAWQGRMVAFVFGESLARGIARVYWHSLADPPAGAGGQGGFGTHSLLRLTGSDRAEGFARKPAGEVYARLVDLLGTVPVADVRTERVQGGRAVRVGAAGLFIYDGNEVPLPSPRGEVVDLLSGGSVQAPVVAAPVLVRPPPG